MKKLLISTTALSVALSPFHSFPARAQTLLDDGSVVAADGSLLCAPSADAACDLGAIIAGVQEAEAAAAAQAQAEAEAAAAAQAEADAAAAQAAAEAAAAAAAQAEADAAAAAQAEADAAAAAAAQADADAAVAAQAEADAAAAAAAQAQADAAAAAKAEAAIAAQAEAEAAAKAEQDAAAAEAAEAALPPTSPAEAAEVVPEPEAATDAPEATAPDAAVDTGVEAPEPAVPAETTPAEVPETAAETTSDPAADSAPAEAQPDAASDTSVETQPEAAPEGAPEATAGAAAEGGEGVELAPPPGPPIEALVPEAEAVDTLTELLSAPTASEGILPEGGAEAPVAAAVAAAGVLSGLPPTSPSEAADTPEVVETVITEGDTRSSAEEFAAAPTAVAGGKKSGLSDLEKVGLVALGALVVGAILKDGRKVVQNSGDRVVVENPDGRYVVYKDDDTLLRRPGVRTLTESYADGSTLTRVQRADGTEVVTVRDASGRVLRRSAYDRQGRELVLIDDLRPEERIVIRDLPKPRPSRVRISTSDGNAALKAELAALEAEDLGRKFSLRQIREIREVRDLAATIEVDTITFDSGSSVIRATEARKLADLGRVMGEILDRNPGEVFLIEGHTDAVGSAASNLSLSDRRAESLALALTEYFEIPPENLVVQGYGESELKVATTADERANRRVAIRLITALMRQAAN